MRVVHKFQVPFATEGGDFLLLPVGARVVHVGIDPAERGRPAIWVELDPSLPPSQRHQFRAYGTGRDVPDGWHYKGTAIHDGQLVWHVYGDRA